MFTPVPLSSRSNYGHTPCLTPPVALPFLCRNATEKRGAAVVAAQRAPNELALWQSAANVMYRNPFVLLTTLGVPAVGGVLYSQLSYKVSRSPVDQIFLPN